MKIVRTYSSEISSLSLCSIPLCSVTFNGVVVKIVFSNNHFAFIRKNVWFYIYKKKSTVSYDFKPRTPCIGTIHSCSIDDLITLSNILPSSRRVLITMQFDNLQRQVHSDAGHSAGQHAFGVVRVRLSRDHFHRGHQENVQVCKSTFYKNPF